MMLGPYDIFSSAWGSDSTEGAVQIATAALRRAGEEEGSDGEDAEIWSHYGLSYRPADPGGDKSTQALTLEVAGRPVIFATRDVRGADIHGDLNAGDVAVWSIGKNAVRLNASGSISMFKQGESVDSAVAIGDDGAITLLNEWGVVQLGKDGFSVTLASGQMLSLGPDGFNVSAPKCALQCGAIALGVGAAVPLASVPTVIGTGTAGPGFVAMKPITNIFI